METLLKADAFFFITTIAIVVVAVLFAVILVYILRILQDVLRISHTVREETEAFAEDAKEIRKGIKKMINMKTAIALASSVVGFVVKKLKKGHKKKKRGS